MPVHDPQGICHLLWGREDRYSRLLHLYDPGHLKLLSGNAGDDGFSLVVDALQGINIAVQDLRLEDDNEAAHIIAIHPDLYGALHNPGILAEGVVHRVHAADIVRQKVHQPLLQRLLQLGEAHAIVDDGIGSYHPQRAGIGYDENPLPVRQGLLGYSSGKVEHMLIVPSTDDPRLAEDGAIDLVVSSQGSSMGGHCLLSRIGPAGLEHHYGLFHGDLASLVYEPPAAFHRLQIHADDIDVLVLAHRLHDIGLIDVQFVAYGGYDAEVHDMAQTPEHPGCAHPCLGDQADVALTQGIHNTYGLHHAAVSVDDPRAVRSKQPHAIPICDLFHLQFDLLALWPQLRKPGRLDHDIAHAALAALLHYIRGHACRDQNDGHIHRLGHRADAGIGLDTMNLLCSGVDGIELTLELVADQIGEDIPAQLSGRTRSPDHRYALRIEEVMQILLLFPGGWTGPGLAQDDSGVDHSATMRIEEHGIQIHLPDAGLQVHKIRYPHQ